MPKCRMCCISNSIQSSKITSRWLAEENACPKKAMSLHREGKRATKKSDGGACCILQEKRMSNPAISQKSGSKKVYQWQDLQELVSPAILSAPRIDWSAVERRHIQYLIR